MHKIQRRSFPLILVLLLVNAVLPATLSLPEAQAANPTRKNRIPETARMILEHADQFELLWLDPRGFGGFEGSTTTTFHGYKILGRTNIIDGETRKRLVTSFEQGVAENDGSVMMCFNPRHGISVTSRGRKEDFVICFECLQVEAYGAVKTGFLTSGSPLQVFNQVLRDAHVLPTQSE
jgi:hypothetical protein